MNYTDLVQQLYIAYYGRPADPTGLAAWVEALTKVNGDTSKIIASFADSAESKALYNGTSTVSFVNQIYNNVLGRDADITGLTGYAKLIDTGALTRSELALVILKNVSGTDVALAANKLAAAKAFTAAIDTAAEVLKYTGDTAAQQARDFLKAVTGDTTTVPDAAKAQTAVDGLTGASANPGKNFTLTTGTDTITGTAGDDTITGGALAADGVTGANTLNALDSIDGGAGVDTLVLDTTANKNNIAGTITNVENLTYVGSGAAINGDATIDLSSFSGKFTLSQTADTAVAVSNVKNQTLALNKVATGTTLTAALDAAQTSVSLANTAAVGTATFSVSGTKLDTVNLSTDKTAGALTVADTGNTTKTLNVAATGTAAVTVNSTALETVKVTGAGAVTLTAGTAPSKALDASGSTGGVTYAVDLVAQQFTGGAGKDVVQFGATTKAQTLGAGDDTATISADLGTGGSIDAGEGTDTLQMAATLAATLDDNTDFNAKVSGFEKLSVTAATNQTLDLANLDGLNYVIEAGNGNTLTINNMVSGGTFEFTDASTATTVAIKDAATGTADVLNVKVSAAATVAAGTLTAANVETVNINADDTATTPAQDGSVKHTLTLTADKATKVVVTGDASLSLTLTGSTKVATIDASAATSGFTTNLSVASGITLIGTAKADTITLGQLSVVTGGEGKDAYTITQPTNGNTYATITDFKVTETIQFTDKGDNGVGVALGNKLSLAGTALFADYLNAAAAGDATTNGIGKWFQFGGDTYLVLDRDAANTFQNGVDQIVKLTGALDLSKSTFDTDGLFTYTAV